MTDKSTAELIQTETIKALDLYGTTEGMDGILSAIRASATAVPVDLTTAGGRKLVASTAHKVSRLKVVFDGMGKDLVAERKSEIKAVDSERKRLRDDLDALKIEVRKPLTEYEEAEQKRVDGIKAEIHRMSTGYGVLCSDDSFTVEGLRGALASVMATDITEERFGEHVTKAWQTKERAKTALSKAIVEAEEREAQRLELEKLKAEQAVREQEERDERIRRDTVALERREAEQKAEQVKAEAERAAADAQQQIELAQERERFARLRAETAELRARQRIKAEAQDKRDEDARRAQDEALRADAIELAADYMCSEIGLKSVAATDIATEIANGHVPGVTMTF